MSEFKDFNDNNLHSNSDPQPGDTSVKDTVNHTDRHSYNATGYGEDATITDSQNTYNKQEDYQDQYRQDEEAHRVERQDAYRQSYAPVENREHTYQNNCFKEKIKNERKTRKPYVFRKVVAFLLIAVLCGGAFQVGAVVTKPYVEKILWLRNQ